MLLWAASHRAFVRLRTWQIVHIGHLANLSHRGGANKALLLLLAHSLVVLLVLCVFVLPLRFLFTIQHRELFLFFIVLQAKLTPDRNETSQTVNVILVLLVDLLVDLESLLEKIHSSVARGDHELPLDFLRLNLTGAFEVLDSLLEHVLLGVMHAQARDYVDLGRVVTVALLIEVHSLELVLLLLVQVAHLGEDFGI